MIQAAGEAYFDGKNTANKNLITLPIYNLIRHFVSTCSTLKE
jgi:hypothetical protein